MRATVEPRWKPGQSGNPAGRAKAVLRPLLLKELEREVRIGKTPMSAAVAIARNLVQIAMSSKRIDAISAAKLILAYTDGLPEQTIKVDVYDAARDEAAKRGLDPENVVSILDGLRQRRTG